MYHLCGWWVGADERMGGMGRRSATLPCCHQLTSASFLAQALQQEQLQQRETELTRVQKELAAAHARLAGAAG